MNLSEMTISALQQARLRGEISASEIASHTLQSIAQHNPQLNAWTEVTRQRMLQEAAVVDRNFRQGDHGSPLSGIPYGVKNLFDVQGYTTVAGAKLFAARPAARQDAHAVSRLRQSGALLSGMLNMDAYAYGFTTENSHYGPSHNPRDLQRIAGGSSGGSAAAVAAGLIPFSLGTDTNGSIRVPAALCGVFGLKPTYGRLSRQGSHPFVASLDHIGPFARNVTDLSLVYDCLQGNDPDDAFQSPRPAEPSFTQLDHPASGLRVGVLGGYFSQWCDEESRQAVATAARALNASEDVEWADAELARSAAFIISASEGGNHYLPALRQFPELFEIHSRERLLAGAMLPGSWYVQAQRFRRHFCQQILPLFDNIDILLAPATPCSATLINQQTMRINQQDLPVRASMGMLTQPVSFIGLPVCTVPLPAANGLSVGVQIIAAPFKEAHALQAARALEQQKITLPPFSFRNITE
ncbi:MULTISPECIES: AtzE family amidohydrolase [unclassified Tatumella]|uniref:AtzE family amidohydrolase n=1 Tax=unclassified Tatumella TaxID=2649542 RepID=UPI001BAE591C|nr:MULTISPECIES: AtzE family amidohydrolase [unclassified Tatumella]MBS0878324.1 AtzE family amidohydrolase [Tatumella sp. JGM82]MBS0891813.1 AtzE family amidohydrolase [Tatumella sp. JGM94]MBS0903054.1 AtzE family amidohydrolase [Tatumella sp. JGM100]